MAALILPAMIISLCHVTYHLHKLWRLGHGHLWEVTVLATTPPTSVPHSSPPLLSRYYLPSGASGPCPVQSSTGAFLLTFSVFARCLREVSALLTSVPTAACGADLF